MGEIRKILAAIAFSDYSQGILEFAAQQVRAFEAELIVAYVINSRDVEAVEKIAAQGYNLDSGAYVRELKAQHRNALADLLKPIGLSGNEVKTVFKVGHPVDTLLRIIVAEKADMVVMGLKGRSDIEYTLTGSVAEKLFRRCPVPLISYRGGKHAERLLKRIH